MGRNIKHKENNIRGLTKLTNKHLIVSYMKKNKKGLEYVCVSPCYYW